MSAPSVINKELNKESLFKCSTVCNDNYHKNQLKLIYSKIIEVIHTSSDHLKIAKMPKFKKVPGWNQNAKMPMRQRVTGFMNGSNGVGNATGGSMNT